MTTTLILFIDAPEGVEMVTVSDAAFAAAVRDCGGCEMTAASCIAEDTPGCNDYRLIEA